MNKPLALSIGIPHLNDQNALASCLAALAAQQATAPAFEVIVVDNGSETLPTDVVARFDFARLAEEQTPGPGPARNTAVSVMRSDLIAFIDADCIADPGWVAGIIAYFADHPETDVIGGDVRILPRNPSALTAIEAYESIYGYRMQLYVERDHYTATCNMALRRAMFEKAGGFGGIDIAEDKDWGLRATALGARIDYVQSIGIKTPARDDFGQLRRKWDRHIGHDFTEASGLLGWVRWCLRTVAVAASPIAELPRVFKTDRVSGPRNRLLALATLTRLRLFRARRMLGLAIFGNSKSLYQGWRQQP
ncbi:MAG: glycosyltransferase family 2 protein [Microgenomates group bacterium]